MSGRIRQINTSASGIPKTPVAQAEIGPLGIAGDGHRPFRSHGGPRKALLLMASEVVDALRLEGWPVFYGALGENLTTSGLNHRAWRSGQCFRMGDVLIELTTPREPCRTLHPYGAGIQKRLYDGLVKADDPAAPHWGESGFYAAVLRGGVLLPDAIIEFVEQLS